MFAAWRISTACCMGIVFLTLAPTACTEPTLEPGPNRRPEAVGVVSTMDLALGDTVLVDLSSWFQDDDVESLRFEAHADNPWVATVTVEGSDARVIGTRNGETSVVVTARDRSGLAASLHWGIRVGTPVSLEASVAQAVEGGTVAIDIFLGAASTEDLTLAYSVTADTIARTPDADGGDYGEPTGSITIPAGALRGSIVIPVPDDSEIEPPREVFVLMLERPPLETGYVRTGSFAATVAIREGVCDRTLALQEVILEALDQQNCTDPDHQDLANVTSLDLGLDPDESESALRVFSPADLMGLSRLEWLSLRGNKLRTLPVNSFDETPALRVLDLASNEIEYLPTTLFSSLSELEWLSLHNNRLADLSPSPFSDLRSLLTLHLSGNRIDELPEAVFEGMSGLDQVTLSDNPGAPFQLTLELERIDGKSPGAPLPARLRINLREGAPFDIVVPLWAAGSKLTADAPRLSAGTTQSSVIFVSEDDRSEEEPEEDEEKEDYGGAVAVSFLVPSAEAGYCPVPCDGFEVVASEPLVLRNPDSLQVSLNPAYVSQAIQTRDGSVPLVAGRRSVIRAFVTANYPNTITPIVRVRFLRQGIPVHQMVLEAPPAGIPRIIEEGRYERSFNALLPDNLLAPGTHILLEMDTAIGITLTEESTTRFPAIGHMEPDVRVVDPLKVTVMAIQWTDARNQDLNGRVTDLARQLRDPIPGSTASEMRRMARTLLPIPDISIEQRPPYLTSADTSSEGIFGLLGEIDLVQALEGARDEFYVGLFSMPRAASRPSSAPWPPGVAVLEGRSSLVNTHTETVELLPNERLGPLFAHELGHNLGRPHTPCDRPSADPGQTDPTYPHMSGVIGAWGSDLDLSEGGLGDLYSPSGYKDLMSYCYPQWVSDHTWTAMLEYWEQHSNRQDSGSPMAGSRTQRLVLWGGVYNGQPFLRPALVLPVPELLPERPGPYEVLGLTEDGQVLFRYSFEPREVNETGSLFRFAVPYRSEWEEVLYRLEVRGPGGRATVDREAGGRAALLWDETSRRVQAYVPDMSQAGGVGPSGSGRSTANQRVIRGLPRGRNP